MNRSPIQPQQRSGKTVDLEKYKVFESGFDQQRRAKDKDKSSLEDDISPVDVEG